MKFCNFCHNKTFLGLLENGGVRVPTQAVPLDVITFTLFCRGVVLTRTTHIYCGIEEWFLDGFIPHRRRFKSCSRDSSSHLHYVMMSPDEATCFNFHCRDSKNQKTYCQFVWFGWFRNEHSVGEVPKKTYYSSEVL